MKPAIKNRRLIIVGGKPAKGKKLIAELLNKTFPEQWDIPVCFSYQVCQKEASG